MKKKSDQKDKRVLIVEDEESNYELICAMIRHRKLNVDWAQTGMEAIQYCEKNCYDLILMDIKMPEMNGYEAIEKLKAMDVASPIIAQTAYARLEDEEKALNLGFDDYISKPIDRNKLSTILDKYI